MAILRDGLTVFNDGLIMGPDAKCPYCGYVNQDSWELDIPDGGSSVIDCLECEKKYEVYKHVDISYNSKPVEQ